MALQSDVPLAPAWVGSGNRVVGYQCAIKRYFDARGGRLDFEGIPLTCRLGSHYGNYQGVLPDLFRKGQGVVAEGAICPRGSRMP
jgi:CcmE